MSVQAVPAGRSEDDRSRGGSPQLSGVPEFDRTPPQDIAAEQSVLGGMLLSKDAIADVIEILRDNDFYRPAHAIIFETILDLYGRGEPADPITISAALTESGELPRVGGVGYLHTLIASVPTAANAGYYARIVAERAVLRRLIEAGTRIAQLGYSGTVGSGRDVDDVVDLAQQAVYEVTERRTSEDYTILEELLQPAMDEIEAIGAHGDVMSGVPTGFADLDRLTNGFHPGQLIIVAGRPGLGKALALDTPIPTPTGWTTMGDIAVGDLVLGADGRPVRVLGATDVMTGHDCFRVRFSDGSEIVADADHLWLTETQDGAAPAVRTTRQIAATLQVGAFPPRPNHAIPTARPLRLPSRGDLPLPPYALGGWLAGDGSASIVEAQRAVRQPVAAGGVPTRELPVRHQPGDLGSRGDRQIPGDYLRASQAQRRALLAGLLDTAGVVGPAGRVSFTSPFERVAAGVLELVAGLGYQPRLTRRPGAYAVAFTAHDDVFWRSAAAETHRLRRASTPRPRYVTAVEPIESVPVRCIRVAAADHLFLAGRAMIPTHNSTAGLDWVRSCSVRNHLTSCIFSLEMSKIEIVMRLLSAEARVPLHALRSGQLSEDDWTKLARQMGDISEAPLYIDDSPNMTLMEIRAKARRLKQRHDLRMILVDYMQLMSSPKRTESRQQEVSELSRGLKLMAKELEVPVIAVSQLNRGPEQRTDKRPQLSDLRESGCLPASTRIVRADTGAEVTIGELMTSGARDVPVWALDSSLRYVPRTMTHAFASGVKETFQLRLASGRQVLATANHPFLSYQGWQALGELRPGMRVAVPRHVPAPLEPRGWAEPEVVLLAHLIGAGAIIRRPIRYAGIDPSALAAVEQAARHFGVTATPDDYPAAFRTTLRLAGPDPLVNPLASWLSELGLLGRRADQKFLPEGVFALPKRQVASFLRHLWAAGGHVRWDGAAEISFATASRRLADDVARLLMRFGVRADVRTIIENGYRDAYAVAITEPDDQLRFLRGIGVFGAKSAAAERCRAELERRPGAQGGGSGAVWERLRDLLATQPALAMAGAPPARAAWRQTARPRLGRMATVLDDAGLEMLATNDVYWDEIVSITSVGAQPVYDATVLGEHNFIADGVAVHNSIEQDADMVILLHRDDYYEKESPRAGEADFIVAKHRNGPTDTITVAFQGHFSRFVDMSTGG